MNYRRRRTKYLGDGSDLERCTDDDDQIDLIPVSRKSVVEIVRQFLPEECYVRLCTT